MRCRELKASRYNSSCSAGIRKGDGCLGSWAARSAELKAERRTAEDSRTGSTGQGGLDGSLGCLTELGRADGSRMSSTELCTAGERRTGLDGLRGVDDNGMRLAVLGEVDDSLDRSTDVVGCSCKFGRTDDCPTGENPAEGDATKAGRYGGERAHSTVTRGIALGDRNQRSFALRSWTVAIRRLARLAKTTSRWGMRTAPNARVATWWLGQAVAQRYPRMRTKEGIDLEEPTMQMRRRFQTESRRCQGRGKE